LAYGLGVVGLRHDIDTVLGLLLGVDRVLTIEDRFDVRSTFYVRLHVVKRLGKYGIRLLERLVAEGWKVGLHIDNSADDVSTPSPWHELSALEELLGGYVETVTVHGGLFGTEKQWLLSKLCGLGRPVLNVWGPGYCMGVPTVTLDWMVARGVSDAAAAALKMLLGLVDGGLPAAVLTHPEYFVVSVGARFTLGGRAYSVRTRVLKVAEKFLIPFYFIPLLVGVLSLSLIGVFLVFCVIWVLGLLLWRSLLRAFMARLYGLEP